MTKDRLQELKKIMQTDENQDGGQDAPTESTLIAFFELARTIKHEIENLRGRVSELKILLHDNQQWSNTQTRKEIEHKIEEQKLVIGNLARTIRTNLKSMKISPVETKGVSVIQRIKNVQINAIINELNDILRDYLQCLVEHRDRSVKIFTDMLEVKGEKGADINALLEEGKIAIFTNNYMLQYLIHNDESEVLHKLFFMKFQLLIGDMEEKYNLREAEERHKEIMKMESSILEIRNLFNELALIVDLQGDKIMQVEKLADDNLTKVESGKSKLSSAARKKRKFRYKKLIIALACGMFIIAVVVVLSLI